MAIEGVDFSYDHPTVAQLKAAGKRFVCRYLTGTTTAAPGSKNLTPSEAQALQAAGLDVVSNYETSEGFMLGGYDAGAKAATAAWKQHQWCGGPDEAVIYFSLDLNATYDQWKMGAKPFLRGAASVLGWGRVGMYGGLEQVDWAHAELGMDWLWQSLGWSYGQLSKNVVLQQYKNGVTLGSGTVDLDHAFQANYGQWGAGQAQEDLSIVDAETKAYFDDFRKDVQHGFVLVLRGDDTHTDNLDSIHADTQKILAGGVTVHLDLSQATPQQIQDLGNAIANGLVVKGAGYTGTVDLSPKPAP